MRLLTLMARLTLVAQGTISKKILRDFKFSHLSTGDSLRAHVNNNTPLGQEAKSFMEVNLSI